MRGYLLVFSWMREGIWREFEVSAQYLSSVPVEEGVAYVRLGKWLGNTIVKFVCNPGK